MSQYSSQFHIKVVDTEVWKRFKGVEAVGLDDIYDWAKKTEFQDNSYYINGDYSASNSELYSVVESVADIIGEDGIMIASNTNINVDRYSYCVYYIGQEIGTRYFEDDDEKCDACDYSIEDILGWIEYCDIELNESQKEILEKCGVVKSDNCKNKIVLKDGIKEIADYEFCENQNMDGFEISPSVEIIGEGAFYESNIKHIKIPPSVKVIKKHAFALTDLTSIELPKTLERIESEAFGGCYYLKEIRISPEIDYIHFLAFGGNRMMDIETIGKESVFSFIDDDILSRNDGKNTYNSIEEAYEWICSNL